MNCNEPDKTDFFTGFSVTVTWLASSSSMYSDKSRDPTAITFRLPEGETLRFEIKVAKKRYSRFEISYSYRKAYKLKVQLIE